MYVPASRQQSSVQQHTAAPSTARSLPDNRPSATDQRRLQEHIAASPRQAVTLQQASQPQAPPIQRMINARLNAAGLVKAFHNSRRPPGCLPRGSQGDHLTPFSVLQYGLVNAITDLSLPDAWASLQETYASYQLLPGWVDTPSYVKNSTINNVLTTEGGIGNLVKAANMLLSIRNKIALTSVPNGGTGHGEGSIIGGLQYLEKRIRSGRAHPYRKRDVLKNMYDGFEHARFRKMTCVHRRKRVIKQHAMTMIDSFPLVAQDLGITTRDVENAFPK